jgi:ABC-type proline/glycine betaine transport system ATPase subunit
VDAKARDRRAARLSDEAALRRRGPARQPCPLLAETGTSTLLATHDVREAAALADRVAILHAGKIRQIGPTAEVFAKPADDDCARIVSSFGLDLLASPRG